ncbi:TPA: class I SAM-dependent methyltransferase [Candidatus Bathyarchaeota archaeon]|nr:class I SAM-dependent methyltransferase [Candidatus Bathyarchaeota archaeon]
MAGPDKISGKWDAAGDSWSDFLDKGKDYFRDEMNKPAFLAVVGDVKGRRILDIGCGEGNFPRLYAKMGAEVVGVDFSPKMIELARQAEKREKQGIEYVVSDAARLEGVRGKFDAVTCFMALMDIERYRDAIREAANILNDRGRFIFCITHPCFEYGKCLDREPLAKWVHVEEDKSGDAGHLEVTDYFQPGVSEVIWDMERLVKPFKTTSFHRTLTDYFDALADGGFVVSRLVEAKPTQSGVSKYPSLRKHAKIPHSITIEARKISID